jgi:hypothetical protein
MAYAVLQHRALDASGNLLTNVDIRVRRETAGLPLVSIYSDRDGTIPLANPTTGGQFSDGRIRAYIAGGSYRVELLVDSAVVDTFYNVAVGLGAESDAVPVDGANAGFKFTFNTATSGDPGSGAFLFNNATFASITALNISETDADANSLAALIARWDDGTSTIRGELSFIKPSTGAFRTFDITGTLTDNGTYDTFSATPVASGGSFSNGDECFAFFIPKGDKGDTGSDGSDPGILLTWDTGTTDADPGAGEIRANNASLASATFLYVNKANRAASDIEAFLLAMDDSSNTIKGDLVLTRPADDIQASFKVTSITDATGYVKVGISTHSGATSFTAADPISFQFSRAGDSGTAAGVRELLTGNRTYYVRTDGSDSNTGLVDSAGGAFLTIQKAVDVAAALDLAIYSVTIQVRDGTYTGAVSTVSYIGAGPITIQGNTTTPANVVVSTTSANAFDSNGVHRKYVIDGFKVATTTSGYGIIAQNGSVIDIKRVEFGACASGQIASAGTAIINLLNNITISGNSAVAMLAINGGQIIAAAALTATFSGAPAYSAAFVQFLNFAEVSIGNITWSGSATGKKFSGTNNSVGIGFTSIPGSTAGTIDTGAQCDAFGETPHTRVSTQFDKTSDTTLANITGLTATLKAGLTYKFRAVLFTSSNTSGGVKFAIAGTATATAIRYQIDYTNNATNAFLLNSPQTALAGAAGVTATAAGLCVIEGLITVNAAGTLTVQFAQNASNAAASSVLVGSHFTVERVV